MIPPRRITLAQALVRPRSFGPLASVLMALWLGGAAIGCAHQADHPPVDSGDNRLVKEIPTDEEESAEPDGLLDTIGSGVAGFFGKIGQGLTSLSKLVSGESPGQFARQMQSDNADARRMGINGLVDEPFGQRPPYTTRYEQIADSDPDPLVRATAIRALNRSRDKSAANRFIQALSDPSPIVRLEAVKALNRVPDDAAAAPLAAILTRPDENKDLRIAAAQALRHYQTLEVARALVANLSNRDFGIAFQARRSLRMLTGRDLRFDEAAWLAYLTGPDKPFG